MSSHPNHKAFTLIELLLVMTIIAILSAMSFVGMRVIQKMVKNNLTRDRMEATLTAFAQLGQSEGSAAQFIQHNTGLNGVLEWRKSNFDERVIRKIIGYSKSDWSGGNNQGQVSAMVPVDQTLPNTEYWENIGRSDPFLHSRKFIDWSMDQKQKDGYANPKNGGLNDGSKPYLRYPWGESPPEQLRDPNNNKPDPPDRFLLRHCSTQKTRELLLVSGVIPTNKDPSKKYSVYQTDRSTKRDWNDAWGRPLVVAFAMYQPPKNNSQDNLNTANFPLKDSSQENKEIKDTILTLAREKYKRVLTVYLSVAALGPVLPPEFSEADLKSDKDSRWTGATGMPALIWKRVAVGGTSEKDNAVCQPYDSSGTPDPLQVRPGEWSELSWGNPPWKGIKKADLYIKSTKTTYTSFLSHPIALN